MPEEVTEGELIAEVTHYFGHIEVAVLELAGTLKVGDEIRIVGGTDTDFNQTVDSMEVEHKKVQEARKGDVVGLKVKERVREGYKVYRL